MTFRLRPGVLVSIGVAALALALFGGQSAQAQQPASTVSYNLGQATIDQPSYPEDSRFRTMTVTLQGVLAVPEGEGPFPVALIIHGSYPFCTAMSTDAFGDADVYPCPPENDLRQYEGFTYLAEALAARGYLTLVPDLSAEFNNGFGVSDVGVRSRQIIQAHLDALTNGGSFGVDVAGKADLNHMVAVSHSRGGPLAERMISGTVGPALPLKGLVMIAPATPFTPEAALAETLPVALVVGQCDGDVGLDEPRYYLPLLPNTRPAPVLFMTLPGATHNAFSAKLGADPRETCAANAVLDAQAQRDFTVRFVPDFFGTALAYDAMTAAGQ